MIWLIKNDSMKGRLGKLVLPIFIETALVMLLGVVRISFLEIKFIEKV